MKKAIFAKQADVGKIYKTRTGIIVQVKSKVPDGSIFVEYKLPGYGIHGVHLESGDILIEDSRINKK